MTAYPSNTAPLQEEIGKQAVVIGASVAGLLTASVLSEHFDRVLVFDRDQLPLEGQPRATVPQEYHVHLLLQRGKLIFEQLLPGFAAELEDAGALVADLCLDVKCHQAGLWKRRWESGITAHYCSRTLLEHVLRKRVSRIANVEIAGSSDVEDLIFYSSETRVRGVNVRQQGRSPFPVRAALIVDAGGRGSKAEQWLTQAGYEEAQREQIITRLGYVSAVFEPPADFEPDWRVLLCLPRIPDEKRMAVISPIERGRWMVTAGAWFDQQPEPELAALHEYLANLPVRDLYEAVRSARLVSPLRRYRMLGGLRRHFDRMTTWPDGFLVVGDAVCSINPIYSQGMSASALQAEALRSSMQTMQQSSLNCRRLQEVICRSVEAPWQQAAAVERRFDGVGDRPKFAERLRIAYIDRLVAASAVNRKTAVAMLRVNNLVQGPETLFRPVVALRALFSLVGARLSSVLGEVV